MTGWRAKRRLGCAASRPWVRRQRQGRNRAAQARRSRTRSGLLGRNVHVRTCKVQRWNKLPLRVSPHHSSHERSECGRINPSHWSSQGVFVCQCCDLPRQRGPQCEPGDPRPEGIAPVGRTLNQGQERRGYVRTALRVGRSEPGSVATPTSRET